MKQRMPIAQRGDPIKASMFQTCADIVNRQDNTDFGGLKTGLALGSWEAMRAPKPAALLVVRTLVDSLPPAIDEANPGSPNALGGGNSTTVDNAAVQVWDQTQSAWVNDGVNYLTLYPKDGLPLPAGVILTVWQDPASGLWVPLSRDETLAVRVTSSTPNSDGLFTGVPRVWSSDANSWADVSSVHVLVTDPNGGTSLPEQVYQCRLVGHWKGSCVYAIDAVGGGASPTFSNVTITDTLTVEGPIVQSASTASVSGDQTNYPAPTTPLVVWNVTANVYLNSVVAPSPDVYQRFLIYNASTNGSYIRGVNEESSHTSTATNRIHTASSGGGTTAGPGYGDEVVGPGQFAEFTRDSNLGRWRMSAVSPLTYPGTAPTQNVSSNQPSFDPGPYATVPLNFTTTGLSIQGILPRAPSGRLVLGPVTGNPGTLSNQSASAGATNQKVTTGTGADLSLPLGSLLSLLYNMALNGGSGGYQVESVNSTLAAALGGGGSGATGTTAEGDTVVSGSITVIGTGGGTLGANLSGVQVGTGGGAGEQWQVGTDMGDGQFTWGAIEAGSLIAYRLQVFQTVTLDRIGFSAFANTAGTVHARVGLYGNKASGDNYPGALLVDGGSQLINNFSTTLWATTINQQLTPGTYWLAFNCDTTGNTASVMQGTFFRPFGIDVRQLNGTFATGQSTAGWQATSAYGALPNPYPAGAAVLPPTYFPTPIIAVRVASAP
jgi:hypothetical protein